VKLLLDHREELVTERTRMQQGFRRHLHELEPGLEVAAGALDRHVVLDRLTEVLAKHQGVVGQIAAELLDRIRQTTQRVRQRENQITEPVGELAPSLLALEGCAALSAAKILVRRRTSAAAARVAPTR
jgi:hypothetical protein